MTSAALGRNISPAEVTNVSAHGFWLFVGERELFVPFTLFPWFRDASIPDDPKLTAAESGHHLYWLDFDIDIAAESDRASREIPARKSGAAQHAAADEPREAQEQVAKVVARGSRLSAHVGRWLEPRSGTWTGGDAARDPAGDRTEHLNAREATGIGRPRATHTLEERSSKLECLARRQPKRGAGARRGGPLEGGSPRGGFVSRNLREAISAARTFRGADLRRANLREADLSGADLGKAQLYRANLNRATLTGANLTEADLSRVFLKRADLRGANLRGADLRLSVLVASKLDGAHLTGARAWNPRVGARGCASGSDGLDHHIGRPSCSDGRQPESGPVRLPVAGK